MTHPGRLFVAVGAALLVASGAGFAWRSAAAGETGFENEAAYRALAGPEKGPALTLSRPVGLPLPGRGAGGVRALYWLDADRIRAALSDPKLTNAQRSGLLRRSAEELVDETAGGSSATRSQALSLAALASIIDASMSDSPKRRARLERSAELLRDAIQLDPTNAEAKANLELLLQALPGFKNGRQGSGDASKKQGASAQGASAGAAGGGEPTPPGGY